MGRRITCVAMHAGISMRLMLLLGAAYGLQGCAQALHPDLGQQSSSPSSFPSLGGLIGEAPADNRAPSQTAGTARTTAAGEKPSIYYASSPAGGGPVAGDTKPGLAKAAFSGD